MIKLLNRYRHLSALFAIVFCTLAMAAFGIIQPTTAILILGCFQLSKLAISKQSAACFVAALTQAEVDELAEIVKDLNKKGMTLRALPEKMNGLEREIDELKGHINKMRRRSAASGADTGVYWRGHVPYVSDEFAQWLTAQFVCDAARINGALEHLIPDAGKAQRILTYAKSFVGAEVKAGGALNTGDIPMPTIYMPQIVELVFRYGQARQYATIFPLGSGTVKLPRLQAGEDNFGFIGVGTAGNSQNIPEKEVEAALVTFTANKAGGLIRIPYEIEEDTFIPIGQFLARYIARQFAKLEDTTLFLADGSGTYANITGVGPYCVANNAYLQVTGAGKTKPTDAQLSDFRSLRSRVNAAVLFNMAANGQTQAGYYMHPSMEALLVTFNTIGQPLIYRPPNGGQPATLDGFPIRWIGVSQPYSTLPAAGQFIAFFGDLSFWYLGERGSPRVEISRDVFFATDELAMRALERIDVEAMAVDAMAALQLAAA